MTADLQGEKWPFQLLNTQLWSHSAGAGSSRGVITSGAAAFLRDSTALSLLSCPWGDHLPCSWADGAVLSGSHTWQRGQEAQEAELDSRAGRAAAGSQPWDEQLISEC